MSEEMYEEEYEHIINIDISFTVIKQMTELYKEKCPNMVFKHMDVRSLQFDEGTFDCVIDKGTFDSILCGDGSGPNSEQMLSEIYRVLSPNGVYICISYGVPDQREHYFRNVSTPTLTHCRATTTGSRRSTRSPNPPSARAQSSPPRTRTRKTSTTST